MHYSRNEGAESKENPLRPLGMEEKLKLLNEQIYYARKNSTFYSYLPASPLKSLNELKDIPLISDRDIIHHGQFMICCSAGQIRRIVSMTTSGTTARPKRIAFTDSDLENTVKFFHHGMNTLCTEGDTVIIFMPGNSPDGLCDLLSRGLIRFNAKPKVYSVIHDYDDAAKFCGKNSAVFVGIPIQMRRLALLHPELKPGCALLSADYCAPAVIRTIEEKWGCEVYVHYGMTENGLGCAVETPARIGMIPRQDVILETLQDGGIILTTLRREAMPLIRYCTGDIGELTPDGRLMRVSGRKSELSKPVSIMALDNILLSCDGILDYFAILDGNVLSLRLMGDKNTAYHLLRNAFNDFSFNLEEVIDLPFSGKRYVCTNDSPNKIQL